MKLVLDTNVVASALLWGGAPRLLLQAGRDRRVLLFTCTALLAELTDILARPKFAAKIAASTLTVDELVDRYAAQARWVVTGDKPLLSVTEHQGVRIVSVAEALQGIPPADADSPVS